MNDDENVLNVKEVPIIPIFVDITNHLINDKYDILDEHMEFLYYLTKYVYELIELNKKPCTIEIEENIPYRKEIATKKLMDLLDYFNDFIKGSENMSTSKGKAELIYDFVMISSGLCSAIYFVGTGKFIGILVLSPLYLFLIYYICNSIKEIILNEGDD